MNILLQYFSDFTEEQTKQFAALDALYKEWNEKINVISRKDIDSLYEKHILHSLSIAAIFNFQDGAKIVDLGAGGGFPGIPLAIYFPNVHFHLVDSIGKKLKVVEAVASAIGLKNVTTQHARIEQVKEKFDFVISRAVAPLKDLWQWSKPILKPNIKNIKVNFEKDIYGPGLICLKGGDLAKEVHKSQTRPHVISIHNIFDEPFFKEKYLLYVPK